MPQKSRVSKLPEDLRARLDDMIRSGQYTVTEMTEEIQSLGGEVKRSAIGAYKQRMEERLKKVREAREVAGVWVQNIGEDQDSKSGQLLMQLLHTIAFQTLAEVGGDGTAAEPMDIMLLSKAIKDLAGAQKIDHEYRLKLRAEYQRELAARAAAAAEEAKTTAVGGGLNEAAANRIRELVLGVVG